MSGTDEARRQQVGAAVVALVRARRRMKQAVSHAEFIRATDELLDAADQLDMLLAGVTRRPPPSAPLGSSVDAETIAARRGLQS